MRGAGGENLERCYKRRAVIGNKVRLAMLNSLGGVNLGDVNGAAYQVIINTILVRQKGATWRSKWVCVGGGKY